MSGVYLVIAGGPLHVYVATVPTTLALSYLSYRLAVVAIDFGNHLRVVVDTHRHDD